MWSLKECAYTLNAAIDFEKSVSGFSVDSRLLQPGDLFFALPGSQTHGHRFLEHAAASKAAGAVVEKNYSGPAFDLPLLRVDNVLDALQALARAQIKKSRAQIIAITGSIGKTTAKEFTATLLKQKYTVAATQGNYNSQIGFPLSILTQTTGKEEFLILEMGLTEKGQISKLVEIAPPDIAVITATALVHAQNFTSLDAIGVAKAEIFNHPKTRLGILHADIQNFQELCRIGECYKISFSTSSRHADYFLENGGERLRISGCRFPSVSLMPLKVPAEHSRHNFLLSAVIARSVGMTWQEIQEGMPLLQLPKQRFEQIEKQGITFIDDSYNASEVSVNAAMASMPSPKEGGKKIAVLGEMLELGKFSKPCHQSVGYQALKLVDAVICYGPECQPIAEIWRAAGKEVYFTADEDELLMHVKTVARAGDVILLKGSNSKKMWKILDGF